MSKRAGIQINWTACATIIALFTWTISGVWFAATQSAAITANHASETAAIAVDNQAIAQLQANEKENDKQRVEILLHLSNMDQSLKDILNYGLPRNTQMIVPAQPSGNTAPTFNIEAAPRQQAPANDGKSEQR
jgi:hypothetical protein